MSRRCAARRRTPPAAGPRAGPASTTTVASATPGCRGDRRLDLARLDAEAAQLDLVVGPADELQRAVGRPADQVAGAVHPLAGRAERVRPRTRSAVGPGRPRYPRASPRPPRYSSPACPVGDRLQARVEHVRPRVVHRTADRHGAVDAVPTGCEGGEGRRLGRPVDVDQRRVAARVRAPSPQAAGQPPRRRSTPHASPAQQVRALGDDQVEQGGGEERRGDPAGLDDLTQGAERPGRRRARAPPGRRTAAAPTSRTCEASKPVTEWASTRAWRAAGPAPVGGQPPPRARWVTATPLGRPVDPEVNIT